MPLLGSAAGQVRQPRRAPTCCGSSTPHSAATPRRSSPSSTRCPTPRPARAILRTLRSGVDWQGQVITMLDRAYLAEGVPTLIIWGRRDAIIPLGHGRLAQLAIPGQRARDLRRGRALPASQRPGPLRRASCTSSCGRTEPAQLRRRRTGGSGSGGASAVDRGTDLKDRWSRRRRPTELQCTGPTRRSGRGATRLTGSGPPGAGAWSTWPSTGSAGCSDTRPSAARSSRSSPWRPRPGSMRPVCSGDAVAITCSPSCALEMKLAEQSTVVKLRRPSGQ